MAHYLFAREDLRYEFIKEVGADVTADNYDHRALQQDGIHYDETRDTVVVVADSKEQAEKLVNE